MIAKTLSFATEQNKTLYTTLQILGAALLIAICAQISIPLYFSPVPITGQTFAVMLVGASLGRKKGFLCVLAYLLEGALGLPVFAGGTSGIMKFFGPTGGYFFGFLIQAYLTGWFIEKNPIFKPLRTFAALLVVSTIQMSFGVLWLSTFVGIKSGLSMGFYPFIFGECFKAAGITAFLKYRLNEKNSYL